MKSIFLLSAVLGAVSDASECHADDHSLLQFGKRVRQVLTHQTAKDSKAVLGSMQKVAKSLLEGSETTMDPGEVTTALDAAREALAELEPALRVQVENAQRQIVHAASTVVACHADSQAELRASLSESLGQRVAALESCHNTLNQLRTAEAEQCNIADDCLCDEARTRTTDQETLCTSMTETYEVAFCEHHNLCVVFHECHSTEAEVYQSLRVDVEQEMAIVVQEYIAVEQSRCLTDLINGAMTPPLTPISHAALIACDDVDVSSLDIHFPELPAEPAACPAPPHGDPQCGTRQYEYVGCFVDDGDRDLQEGPHEYGYNSRTCSEACSDYSFFALQNNGWCLCGNAYNTAAQYAQVGDNECGANCADDDQLCGAGWRNAVYSTGRPLPIQYVGCFIDDDARDLQVPPGLEGLAQYGFNSRTCSETCSDYSFFALQNGGQCFCGNTYRTAAQYAQVGDNECGANCADDDQLCGAGWRNAVYSTGRPLPFQYVGCFIDDDARDFQEGPSVTQEGPMEYGYNSRTCFEACSDYGFFALQNGGQCFCGNAYSTAAQYAQVGDNECGANCAHDNRLCGAGWRNAIYRTV